MSDVAVSDLKGGHAPAQKVRFKFLQLLSPVLLQVGGMRVVTRPRVSESEKPVEKTKEEGEEVRCSFSPFIVAMGGLERDSHLLYLTRHTLHDLVYCTNYSGCFRLSRLFAFNSK